MTRPAETGESTTDLGRQSPASPGPASAPAAVTQPLAPPEPTRKLNLSPAQVSAAAAASVTSAVCGSFLGAGGTIGGAALGSIVSTVAGAIYTRSFETAGTKLRETTVRVTQVSNNGARRPGSVPTHLADVDEPPVTAATANLETSVAAPVEPGVSPPAAQTAANPGGAAGAGAPGAPGGPGGPGRPGGPGGPGRPANGTGPRPGRKPLLVTAGVAVAGFGLAIAGITAAEGILGHPVSGGSGGTSIGRVAGADTSTGDKERSPQKPAVTPTESGDVSPSDGPAQEPSDAASPTGEATDTPADDPATEPTDDTDGEPTGAPQEQASP